MIEYLNFFYIQVLAQEQLVFYLAPNSDLWIYLIGRGDEFFLHYENWPDPFPFTFRHMGRIMTQDVVMKKHLSFDDSQHCETKVGEQPYIGMYKNNSTIAIRISYTSFEMIFFL